jgi:Inner membrane protein YgaP-like, transmembrane domain
MTIHRVLRMVAGSFILLSLALAHFVSPNWLWFTAFVGLNLLQSSFTNWCPMISMLKKAGLPETKDNSCG